VEHRTTAERIVAFTMGLTKTQRIWAGVAFAGAVVGSIGPWVTLGVFSKAGTDGDGVLTLIAALLGAILVLSNRGEHTARIGVGLLGLVIVAFGIYDIAEVSSSGIELFGEQISPSVGWGLWAVTLSGAAAVLCPFASYFGIGKAEIPVTV
jgi:hypothetical protein